MCVKMCTYSGVFIVLSFNRPVGRGVFRWFTLTTLRPKKVHYWVNVTDGQTQVICCSCQALSDFHLPRKRHGNVLSGICLCVSLSVCIDPTFENLDLECS